MAKKANAQPTKPEGKKEPEQASKVTKTVNGFKVTHS